MKENDIGFLYAILIPNIRNKTVKVKIDNSSQPLFYKKDEFLELILRHGFKKIKPRIYEALNRTQTVLWKVKEDELVTLSFKAEPDSILADLLDVKEESRRYVEERPITERLSRTEINIDDPDKPVFNIF